MEGRGIALGGFTVHERDLLAVQFHLHLGVFKPGPILVGDGAQHVIGAFREVVVHARLGVGGGQGSGLATIAALADVDHAPRPELRGFQEIVGVLERGVGHMLRCRDVFLHQQGRNGKHIADVVEAVPDIVVGKLVGRMNVHAAQVTDGVIVLGPVQAAQGDMAGIVQLAGGRHRGGLYPGRKRIALRFRGRRQAVRRHVSRTHSLRNSVPRFTLF